MESAKVRSLTSQQGRRARSCRGKGAFGLESYGGEFFFCCLDMYHHLLHVIINPIQHCALVYHHRLQVFEDIRQLYDAFCDFVDFLLALRDDCIIALEAFLRSLLECRLREGFICVRFQKGGIRVWILGWG